MASPVKLLFCIKMNVAFSHSHIHAGKLPEKLLWAASTTRHMAKSQPTCPS